MRKLRCSVVKIQPIEWVIHERNEATNPDTRERMPNDSRMPVRIFQRSIPRSPRMNVRRVSMRRKRIKVRFISMNPAMSFLHDGMGFKGYFSFRVIGAKVKKPGRMRDSHRDLTSIPIRMRVR